MSGRLGYSSEITIAKVNHRALNMEVAYTQEISIPENYPLMSKQNWVSHPKHSQMVHEINPFHIFERWEWEGDGGAGKWSMNFETNFVFDNFDLFKPRPLFDTMLELDDCHISSGDQLCTICNMITFPSKLTTQQISLSNLTQN
mgnify:CR=1 FL=1